MTPTPSTPNTAPTVAPATTADIGGILALQDANQRDQGGTLSARFSRAQLEAMLQAMPQVVARGSDGEIAGFLLASAREMNAGVPVVQAMLGVYPGGPDAYVYGPICVAAAARGHGLAQAMFEELRRLLPGREGVLFIRQDNTASLRAHERMGMRAVAEYEREGIAYAVFSYTA
ncbi:MAG: GNAT family N-acetyltransferase [Pseudomonadota bacterium]